jgi:iron(III) transport system permease protein
MNPDHSMTRWRLALALLLLATVALPVALPFLKLLHTPAAWQAWSESDRLLGLLGQSLGLIAGTLALALPAGTAGALLLYRTDLPFRRFFRFFAILTLFIPLPLFTSAWQAALGTGGWLPVAFWNRALPGDPDLEATGLAFKPWAQGLRTAIFVHAVAALPWVIVLVGQGLRWVERELEEDALTVAGPWRVLWYVTLPRCRAALFAAGLWVALTCLTEITVTDMMVVRTFAEEVYTQLVGGDRTALAQAVAVSLPQVLLTWILVVWATLRWERTLPPLDVLRSPPRLFLLCKAKGWCLAGIVLVVVILAGVPLLSLIWKVGLGGSPHAWSAEIAAAHLKKVWKLRGGMVVQSFLLASASGVFAGLLGLILCWLVRGSRWFQAVTLGLMALVWSLSGPIIGLGLKDTIRGLVNRTEFYPLAVALYYGPSPLPAMWVHLIRFFPCAVAVLWPVVRLIPAELLDAARVDGAGPGREFWRVIVPLTWPAYLRASRAVLVLSLGELSAGKLVTTPGSRTFAQEVFDQMHYGVTNDLAALCLLLLAVVLLGGSIFGFWLRRQGGEE